MLEIVAVVVSVVLGWQSGRIGEREIKALAIIVLGWTAVTTVASLTDFSLAGVLTALVVRTLLIAVPYTIAALARRLQQRRR